MAISIGKAQAKALAEGFFDNLGSKDELQPRESYSELIQIAGELVDAAQTNLNKSDKVASGALSSSLKIRSPELVGKSLRVDIEALFYWQFIDKGVKGTKGGNANAEFSFKNNYVGKRMKEAIRKWLIREGLKAKTKTGGNPITKREGKRLSITETSNRVAYSIGVSVKQKGLKRTNFMARAVSTARGLVKDRMGKALKVDIISAIPKKL